MLSMRSKWLWLIVVALFITAGIYYALHHQQASPNINPTKIVETVRIQKAACQQTIRLLGTIHPQHETLLVAKGSGFLDILQPTGERVTKNTLIAKINNADNEKTLQLSQDAEEIAKNQYQRLAGLLKTGYVSSKEADDKKKIWVDAQKELSKAKIDYDTLRFYAPFDGVIGAYKKREGTQVNVGDPIVSIYDPESLIVDVDLPCASIGSIKPGQKVKALHHGYRLAHVQPMIDDETHMCPADFNIECPTCLIGSTVTVDLVVNEKSDALAIPLSALFLKNGLPHLYLVEDGKIKLQAVKLGIKAKNTVEIAQGLREGQLVVTKGQDRLYPGLAVQVATLPTTTD